MVYVGEGEENLMFNIYLKHLLASWPAWNKNKNDIFCDKLDETCFDYVWHACDTGGPGQCWGSLSPARAAQLRPDTNCIILSDQLILEDLLTQTHITSVVSRVSREWKCKVTSVRAGEFPQSRLRLVTDHISPKLPQPSTLRVSLVTKNKFHAETTSFIGAGNWLRISFDTRLLATQTPPEARAAAPPLMSGKSDLTTLFK